MIDKHPLLSRLLDTSIGASDRRVSPRYPVVQNRAVLAWGTVPETDTKSEAAREKWEQPVCPARILNISNTGALVLTGTRFKPKQFLWLRLADPVPTQWIDASVVGVIRIPGIPWIRKRSYMLRLCFLNPCPYDLFKSATHGRQLDNQPPGATTSDFDGRYWR